jgi:hypothetical protein
LARGGHTQKLRFGTGSDSRRTGRPGSDIPAILSPIHPQPAAQRQRNQQNWRPSGLTLSEQTGNNGPCPQRPQPLRPSPLELDAAADQAIAACGGDAWETVKALIVANGFLEAQLDELRTKVSTGYARGRLAPQLDRKDEADV